MPKPTAPETPSAKPLFAQVAARLREDILEKRLLPGAKLPSEAELEAAFGVYVLGDVHGGAREQAVEMYLDVTARHDAGTALADALRGGRDSAMERHGKFVSGFGHRFHPVDPRAPRLLALVDKAAQAGIVGGRFAAIGRGVKDELAARKGGRCIPMNIDGATAVIYAERGFPAPRAWGLLRLLRCVGILAHAWEQTEQGRRNKGPIPMEYLWTYDSPPHRELPAADR